MRSGSPPGVVVIGGGMAGLAAAWRLARAEDGRRPIRVAVIEGSARLGGKILSEASEGFLVEAGPDAFLARKPEMLELVRELGLEARLLGSNDGARRTWVVHRGRLVALPAGLEQLVPARREELVGSPLLSRRGQERLLDEPRVPPRQEDGDESLAAFVRRRFGREALDVVAEPLLAHVHVGDAERMSLAATYPHLAALERRHGSVTRGVEAGRRARAVAGAGKPPAPIFRSLRGGLGELVEALHRRLGPASVLAGDPAVALRRTAGGYVVRLESGRELAAAAVVLALPAGAAAGLVEGLDPGLARRLRAIPYASIATVSLGYRPGDVDPPAGFGFFVPRGEKRRVLACTFSSNKLDGRAPEGGVLLRAFLGGAAQEELLELDDEELLRAVEEDLRALLDLGNARPALRRLHRFPNGYPQYELGHLERVAAIEAALPPGLAVAGSAYHGVGLPDCIRSGYEAAERVAAAGGGGLLPGWAGPGRVGESPRQG